MLSFFVLQRLFSALLERLEQSDTLLALHLQLSDGFLQRLLRLGFGDIVRWYAVGVVIVDRFESGAP